MITLTYNEVRSGMFQPAFDRLCNNPNLPGKVSYNVSRLAAKLRPHLDKAQMEFITLLKSYAVVDEKGAFTPDPKRGPGSYQIPAEKEEAFAAAMRGFDAKTIEVDRLKFSFKDLESAKLAPNEWLGLEPILHELEAVEEK